MNLLSFSLILTGVLLAYRAVDTLGESVVLVLALAGGWLTGDGTLRPGPASNPALTTDVAGSFAGACSTPTVDDAGGGTTVDVGRRVTFNLGTLTNGSGADQTLTFVYTAVVLDSAGNVYVADTSGGLFILQFSKGISTYSFLPFLEK